MSFESFGPIAMSNKSQLSGWSSELKTGVTAVYGTLEAKHHFKQELVEPISGLVIYIPESGVSLVSKKEFDQQFKIQPGGIFFYAADAGEYFVEMFEPGSYSGLKVFLDVSQVSDLNTQAAKSYRKNQSIPFFSEVPISESILLLISKLPLSAPSKLQVELQLLSDLNQLVAEVLDHWVKIERGHEQQNDRRVIDKQIHAADQYLKNHIIEPPSIISLANLIGLNHMSMKRGFRRHFDSSVYQRLRYWRMQHAITILEQGTSVTNTALEVGYANPSKFAAAFRKEIGCNPSQIFKASSKS